MVKVLKWIRWLLLGLVALLLLSFAVVQWLLHQEMTVDYAVEKLQQLVPELAIHNVQGTLAEGVSVELLQWSDGDTWVTLDEVNAVLRLQCLLSLRVCLSELSARQLTVLIPEGESADPETGLFPLPEVSIPLPLMVDQLQLERFHLAVNGSNTEPLLELMGISGRIRWLLNKLTFRKLQLSYSLAEDEAPYRLAADGAMRFRDRYPLQLDASVSTPTVPGEAELHIEGDLETLQASGNVSGQWPLTFELGLAPLDDALPWDLTLALEDTELNLEDAGTLRLKGTQASLKGKALDIQGNLQARFQTDQWPGENRLSAALQLQAQQLTVSNFRLQLPRGEVSGESRIQLGPDFLGKTGNGDYQGNALLNFAHIDPALFVPDSEADLQGDLSGEIRLDVSTRNQESAPLPELLTVELNKLSGNFLKQVVKGEGQLDWHWERGLRVAKAVLHQAENQVQLSRPWQQGKPVALSFRLPQLHYFSGLLPGELSGSVQGQLEMAVPKTAAGWKEIPMGKGKLAIKNLVYDDLELGTATARLESTQDLPYAITASGSDIRYQAQRIDQLELSLQGDQQRFDLTADASTPDYGELLLRCQGDALHKIPSQQTAIDCSRIRWTPLTDWPLEPWQNLDTLKAVVNLPDRRFGLQSFCLQELRKGLEQQPEVCLDKAVEWLDGNAQVSARAQHLSWQQIRPLMNSDWQADGSFYGQLNATIANSELTDFSASLQSDNSELRLPLAERKLVIDIRRLQTEVTGNLQTARLNLAMDAGDYGQVEGHLTIDREQQLQGSFDVQRFELRTLQSFLIDVTELSGVANGSLTLAGTIDKPSLQGKAEIRNGKFNHLELPKQLTDIRISTRFDAYRADYKGSLTLGDSSADISGQLDWTESPLTASFALQSEEIEFTPLPQTDIWVVPDIKADYRGGQLKISGSVQVPRAFINIKSLPKNSVGVSSDVVIVDSDTSETEETPLYANVDMQLGSDVLFRGFGLETHLKGNLRLEYSPQQLLQGNGFVQLVEGTYRAYGQNLKIRSGELIFVGPIDNPTIHVDAVRADITDAVTVGIRAEGPAKSPSVTLFSQPAMSDQKKLHYLVTGQAPGEGQQQDSSALLSQAAVSLGAATGESALQDYADKLGIRNFQISAGEGDSGAEVQLSGYVNPRLFVRYGMGMFEDVNSLTMRYKLRSNLFLEAVSSTANTLDLLWTFQVGESRPKEKQQP